MKMVNIWMRIEKRFRTCMLLALKLSGDYYFIMFFLYTTFLGFHTPKNGNFKNAIAKWNWAALSKGMFNLHASEVGVARDNFHGQFVLQHVGEPIKFCVTLFALQLVVCWKLFHDCIHCLS